MTNNQLTDERVTSVIERLEHYACNLKWTNVRGAQDLLAAADGLRELQERRKAAMDSEPVAEVYQPPNVGICAALGPSIRMLCPLEPGTKLYRHAQPAQVVPEEATPDSIEILASGRCRDHVVYQWDEDQRNAAADSWNACRADMLNGGKP